MTTKVGKLKMRWDVTRRNYTPLALERGNIYSPSLFFFFADLYVQLWDYFRGPFEFPAIIRFVWRVPPKKKKTGSSIDRVPEDRYHFSDSSK